MYLAEPSVGELSRLRLGCCRLSGQPEFDLVTRQAPRGQPVTDTPDQKSLWGPFYPDEGHIVIRRAEGSSERHKTARDSGSDK